MKINWMEFIAKNGFAAFLLVFVLWYVRTDFIIPAREETKATRIAHDQFVDKVVESTVANTKSLGSIDSTLKQIRDDQRKFPAVAENKP